MQEQLCFEIISLSLAVALQRKSSERITRNVKMHANSTIRAKASAILIDNFTEIWMLCDGY